MEASWDQLLLSCSTLAMLVTFQSHSGIKWQEELPLRGWEGGIPSPHPGSGSLSLPHWVSQRNDAVSREDPVTVPEDAVLREEFNV